LGRADSRALHLLNPEEYKLIIIDEAHHATAATYLRILDYFGVREDATDICLWGCSAVGIVWTLDIIRL